MPKRDYDGKPLDQTWQDLKDRPYKGKGKTVDATDSEDLGRVSTAGVSEAVRKISQDSKFDDVDGWVEEMRNWDFEWRQELAADDGLPMLVRVCLVSSILQDMSDYNARIDNGLWTEYIWDIEIPIRRLEGALPFHERQYIGDPALHGQYEKFVTEILPERAPDPLDQPVRE